MAKEYNKTIKFIGKNGNTYTFKTMQNVANSNQMWWIVEEGSMFSGTIKDAKSVIKTN